MIHFWDASALIPLLIKESSSDIAYGWHAACEQMTCWTLTSTEIYSALCRRMRDHELSSSSFSEVVYLWNDLETSILHVDDLQGAKKRAERLLRIHPLKAADALQLAAALIITDEYPQGHAFYTFDSRLALAARKEGFSVYT